MFEYHHKNAEDRLVAKVAIPYSKISAMELQLFEEYCTLLVVLTGKAEPMYFTYDDRQLARDTYEDFKHAI